jgi:thioredoxin reductase
MRFWMPVIHTRQPACAYSSAVGEGAMAVTLAHRYLEAL